MAIDLAKAIGDALYEYSDEVVKATNDVLKETAKEAVDELKTAGEFKDKSGDYRKGWSAKTEAATLGIQKQIVYNKKHYRLTHLLEYGHAKPNGGRVRAFPHIATVEEGLADKVEKKLREKLG